MERSVPAVEFDDVAKVYTLGKSQVVALTDIQLTIDHGEFTAIAGPSGSGKTTLLNLIGCVDVPTRGRVLIDGLDTSQLDESALTQIRLRKLGFIFQSFNLIPVLNLYQNVELPLLLQKQLSRAARKERVIDILQRVGLEAHQKHRPNELSGGQRQRVAIARALVTRPSIVLADEPTANLDTHTGATIIHLMHELNLEQRITFIFSTHDPRVMERASRKISLVDGRIVSAGDHETHDAPTLSAPG